MYLSEYAEGYFLLFTCIILIMLIQDQHGIWWLSFIINGLLSFLELILSFLSPRFSHWEYIWVSDMNTKDLLKLCLSCRPALEGMYSIEWSKIVGCQLCLSIFLLHIFHAYSIFTFIIFISYTIFMIKHSCT